MNADKLVASLFDGVVSEPSARETLNRWLRDSARFRAFLTEYETKARKKLRLAEDVSSIGDVFAELRVARHLLANRSFEVRYEAEGVRTTRSPDFAVTFKTHTVFYVEVKRVRPGLDSETRQTNREETKPVETRSVPSPGLDEPHGKLARIVVSKIGQLPPQSPNVLVIIADDLPAFAAAFLPGMTQFQTRLAHKDETLFLPYGYESAAMFQRQYARLCSVICLSGGAGTQTAAQIWKNVNARHPLSDDLTRALRQAFTL